MRCINIRCYHRQNISGQQADEMYTSMIHDKYGHIPSPLIMFTSTVLRHGLLEWQQNKGVHPRASKSPLEVEKTDRSNYFNCEDDTGQNESCCAASGRKLLTSPGVPET